VEQRAAQARTERGGVGCCCRTRLWRTDPATTSAVVATDGAGTHLLPRTILAQHAHGCGKTQLGRVMSIKRLAERWMHRAGVGDVSVLR